MASLSKASQEVLRTLKPWFRFGGTQNESEERPRSSWSASNYSGSTTLLGSERSPSVDAGKPGQHSPHASSKGYKGFSKTLRSVVSLFHIEEEDQENEDPLFTCGLRTPEKQSPRPALKTLTWSRSLTKSRRSLGRRDHGKVSAEIVDSSPSPASIYQEARPVLRVDIPNCSLGGEVSEIISPAISAASPGSHPEVHKDSDDPFVSTQAKSQSGAIVSAPAFELFSLRADLPAVSDDSNGDRGYASDVESNIEAEPSKSVAYKASPTVSKVGFPTIDQHNDQAPRVHFGTRESPRRDTIRDYVATPKLLTNEMGSVDSSPDPPKKVPPLPLHRVFSLRRSLDQLHTKIAGAIHSSEKPESEAHRLPSYTYDADAENSESSPPAPNMGSKADWGRLRSSRNKRYADAIADDISTESDNVVDDSLRLSRSPSRRPEDTPAASSTTNLGAVGIARIFYTGALRYAVEAIERPSAMVLEDEESLRIPPAASQMNRRDSGVFLESDALVLPQTLALNPSNGPIAAYHSEQHRHVPSTSTMSHDEWSIPRNDSLQGFDAQDPYEAGLRAAGFHKILLPQLQTGPTSYEIHEATAQNSLVLSADDQLPRALPSSPVADDHTQRNSSCGSRDFRISVLPLQDIGQVMPTAHSTSEPARVDFTDENSPKAADLRERPSHSEELKASMIANQPSWKQRFLVQHFKQAEDSVGKKNESSVNFKCEEVLFPDYDTRRLSKNEHSKDRKILSSYPKSTSDAKENVAPVSHSKVSNISDLSPSSRQHMGLIKQCEEKEAKALMQLIYDIEAEEEAEGTESDVSGTETVNIG